MDISVFTAILRDRHFPDYRKLQYKYGGDFSDFLRTLEDMFYRELPLPDGHGKKLVLLEEQSGVSMDAAKQLLKPQGSAYGMRAAEEEIVASSAIENIDFNRDSVRRILKGMAPADEQESRIAGIKQGLDFIADPLNRITEENLHRLYMTAVGDFLTGENRLPEGSFYRNDAVYVVGGQVEHVGAPHASLPELMAALISFADEKDDLNDLVKAAILHFYIGYLHPYFDGNGRIARLLHLWFLLQKGYRSALFVPFSALIEKSRKAYYNAYSTVEDNRAYSGRIDVTPFIRYFSESVYGSIRTVPATEQFAVYDSAVRSGKVTEKETRLWRFVLSHYGTGEFSTKQLEKAFGDAAYATIRGFVIKFTEMGLLTSVPYGNRIKYKITAE